MTDPPSIPGVAGRSRLLPWGIGVVLAALTLSLAFGRWRQHNTASGPEPPTLNLDKVDWEIADSILEARQDVLNDRTSGPAWGRLGQVLLVHDYSAEAGQCLAEAERLDPTQPRWPYLHGTILLLSEPEAAVECFGRAAKASQPSHEAPRLRLAETLMNMGRLDDAEVNLQKAAERIPLDRRIEFDSGHLALLRQKWQAALAKLTLCVDDPHCRGQALRMRAQVYRRLGEPSKAALDEKQALNWPRDDSWPDPFIEEVVRLKCGLAARLERAEATRQSGRPDLAIAALEETARLYPGSYRPWLALANAWEGLGRMDRAEQACVMAVQADPELAHAWFALGCAQASARPQAAAESFRHAIRLKPDHTVAHFYLGTCMGRLGDKSAAKEEYRLALQCSPDYEPARKALIELAESKP